MSYSIVSMAYLGLADQIDALEASTQADIILIDGNSMLNMRF